MRYTAKMPQYEIAYAQNDGRDKYSQYKPFCIYFIHLNLHITFRLVELIPVRIRAETA